MLIIFQALYKGTGVFLQMRGAVMVCCVLVLMDFISLIVRIVA